MTSVILSYPYYVIRSNRNLPGGAQMVSGVERYLSSPARECSESGGHRAMRPVEMDAGRACHKPPLIAKSYGGYELSLTVHH